MILEKGHHVSLRQQKKWEKTGMSIACVVVVALLLALVDDIVEDQRAERMKTSESESWLKKVAELDERLSDAEEKLDATSQQLEDNTASIYTAGTFITRKESSKQLEWKGVVGRSTATPAKDATVSSSHAGANGGSQGQITEKEKKTVSLRLHFLEKRKLAKEKYKKTKKTRRHYNFRCPSCELVNITKYTEPLTPPDEPMKEWRHLRVGSHGPLEVNSSQRYYFSEALPDRCAGIAHKRYSMTCAAAEAKALGRQLAVHMTTCLSANHTGKPLNLWVPTAAYFDLELISEDQGQPVVFVEELAERMKELEQVAAKGIVEELPLVLHKFSRETPTEQIMGEEYETEVVVRHLHKDENGFDPCHMKENEFLMPLKPETVPYNRYLIGIAEGITERLGGREKFTAIHVRRGDKAKDHQNWPNLDKDTQPESLLKTLPKIVKPKSTIYIATNEEKEDFFHPLKSMYTVYQMEDFKDLWGPGSKWFEVYSKLLNTRKPELDMYMKGIIDNYMVWVAAQKVETFNDLTKDPRNGVHETCHSGQVSC